MIFYLCHISSRFLRRELGDEFKLVVYGHSMGTGLGSKAVVEVSKEKSVRVDGLIIDSPFHSFEYALKQMPNFYYYSSFFIDWPKLWDIAGLNVNVAEVNKHTFIFKIYLKNKNKIECQTNIF